MSSCRATNANTQRKGWHHMRHEIEATRRRLDPVWRDVKHEARAHAAFCSLWAALKAWKAVQS